MTAPRWAPALAAGMSSAAITYGLTRLLSTADSLARKNYRGDSISLAEGFAIATALTGCSLARGDLAAAVAVGSAAVVGAADDFDAGRHDGPAPAKGLRGHWKALQSGHVSTGVLKVLAIGSASALYAARTRRVRNRTISDFMLDSVIIAGSANIANLFDLRPGRALKMSAMCASVANLVQSNPRAYGAVMGSISGSAPTDLSARTMLGDMGANPLGLYVGMLATHPDSRAFRAVMALLTVGLIGAAEKVSFSTIIDQQPLLRALDRLGTQRDGRE
ncbi:MAG: hypothetical protein Q4P05_04380 [Actinomycetaceae bacterium]|nr:hypothetical protein [Actinomycetaceae bacterium]